jgi:hypothetical protein
MVTACIFEDAEQGIVKHVAGRLQAFYLRNPGTATLYYSRHRF